MQLHSLTKLVVPLLCNSDHCSSWPPHKAAAEHILRHKGSFATGGHPHRQTCVADIFSSSTGSTCRIYLLFITSPSQYKTDVSHCQQPNPGKVCNTTTSGIVTLASMAGSVRLALLLAVLAAAVAQSSAQPTADGGELVQGAHLVPDRAQVVPGCTREEACKHAQRLGCCQPSSL